MAAVQRREQASATRCGRAQREDRSGSTNPNPIAAATRRHRSSMPIGVRLRASAAECRAHRSSTHAAVLPPHTAALCTAPGHRPHRIFFDMLDVSMFVLSLSPPHLIHLIDFRMLVIMNDVWWCIDVCCRCLNTQRNESERISSGRNTGRCHRCAVLRLCHHHTTPIPRTALCCTHHCTAPRCAVCTAHPSTRRHSDSHRPCH